MTVEEGSAGGFGGHVLQTLAGLGLLDGGLKVRTPHAARRVPDHGTIDALYREAGLDADGIVAAVVAMPGFQRARVLGT